MRTCVGVSDPTRLDGPAEGGSISVWTSATTSIQRRSGRTSIGTAPWSGKSKTCCGGPLRIGRAGTHRGSRWARRRQGGISASFTCRTCPGIGVRYHGVPTWTEGAESATASPPEETMSHPKYPVGWDEERVRSVLEHYEAQSDEEAVAEDEAAYEATTHTAMEVPVELVPAVREMIAKRRAG